MWKTFYLLLLMLFTFDFPRDSLAGAEPVRANAELVPRDDDQNHRKETRGRLEIIDEHAAELVGKWRNNGEALEPKWRDGDTVPLLPFSQFSRFSRDKIDNSEEDDYDHRRAKYRQNNRQEDSHRSRNNPPLSYSNYEGYQSTEGRRGYREREEVFSRKRNRPWTGENTATMKEASNRKEEQNKDFKEDKETTSTRYRELFPVRPNDYEHEFNDEEYLKPRPRKRRPPQNYEFALAENETSLNEERTYSNSGPWSRANTQGSPQQMASKNAPFLQNAMELKSLLKMQQEEGLSLSEILQQRNLTLNDLLKGKADVINALKRQDVEETEDYVEEAAKMISNSFVKLSTTRKPQWTFATESVKAKNSRKDEEFVFSIVPKNLALYKNHTGTRGSFSSRVNDSKIYSGAENATIAKSSLTGLDPPQSKVTITTRMPLPVATNSMELVQADDAVVKSQSSDETRTESLDEDEIMEFSDFTDYKKGRSGVSPVWLIMKDGEVSNPSIDSSKSHFEDKGSTLSIEKILSPTERSKSTSNLSVSFKDKEHFLIDSINVNSSGIFEDEDQYSEKDYSNSSEKEYQGDTPIMYYDLEQSTQVSNESEEDDRNKEIIKDIASTLDTVSHISTTNNHQTLAMNLSVKKNNNNTSKSDNINTTEKKSYDDIISEVEPEARAEIFELFASGSAGKRLERLLKSRNMSLEELIALRQRGSSKVHLAEASRIRAQKSNDGYQIKDTNNFEIINSLPSKENLPTERRTIANHENYNKGIGNYLSQSPENFKNSDSLTNFVHPQESINKQLVPNLELKINNEGSELDTSTKMDSVMADTKEKHRTVQIVDLLTTFGSLPFIKDIQQDFVDQYNTEDKEKLLVQNSNLGMVFINNAAETIDINDTSNVVQSGFVKEIVKQEPSSIDIQTIYSKTSNILDEDENKSEKGKTLSKVKPSIIASGAILGVTLVVFLAIFIVCRIRQKQKYRYRNTFSRAVFQGPVMAVRKLSNSSSLSTVMVNVVATSTTKRPEKNETQESIGEMDSKSDIDNDSLDANDSWETIPDYMK
ncbi:PREDICTED: uncharacterized protein LOC108549566 [Eufriesea mexicana]|uniref:uncharacterized protein LOC108549566 n=1 Tax=Eufriesea mexicana TaxID=516756 RepID=UPI00083C57E4|nr:PREDICTED: uncharacterized protein LOC108549566 [Eufriesea mexicana]